MGISPADIWTHDVTLTLGVGAWSDTQTCKILSSPYAGSKVKYIKGIAPADLWTLGMTLTFGIRDLVLFATHLGQIHKPVKY